MTESEYQRATPQTLSNEQTMTGDKVCIVEVGPRDGLQNESDPISVADKVELIRLLSESGIQEIEAGSFVSPKWVPQMASSDEVFRTIARHPDVRYTALTPNVVGLEAALAAGADQVAIFAAASETFSQKNINCSIARSIERFKPLVAQAKANNVPVRAYVSCILGCPYEGKVEAKKVMEVTEQLLALGCYEVSLGDTIGVGTPHQTDRLLGQMQQQFDTQQLALHFHDTYGQAIANTYAALELGFRTFDASVAGLGGCPYAKGASGNVATEDVVYMLNGAGMQTGIDLNKLIEAGQFICQVLQRETKSRAASALMARLKRGE